MSHWYCHERPFSVWDGVCACMCVLGLSHPFKTGNPSEKSLLWEDIYRRRYLLWGSHSPTRLMQTPDPRWLRFILLPLSLFRKKVIWWLQESTNPFIFEETIPTQGLLVQFFLLFHSIVIIISLFSSHEVGSVDRACMKIVLHCWNLWEKVVGGLSVGIVLCDLCMTTCFHFVLMGYSV